MAGDMEIDVEMVAELRASGKFETMSMNVDEVRPLSLGFPV